VPVTRVLWVAVVFWGLGCTGGKSPFTDGGCGPGGTCPQGHWCVTVRERDGTKDYCRATCGTGWRDAGCGQDQFCTPWPAAPDRGICEPRCLADVDCAVGLACDTATGRCVCHDGLACGQRFGLNLGDTYGLTCRGDGICAHACGGDQDCPCGALCSSGSCVPGCRSAGGCCGDAPCGSGQCGPGEPAPWWGHCAVDADCAGSLVCLPNVTRGSCSRIVGSTCVPGSCADAGVCAPYRSVVSARALAVCVPTCEAGSCPAGLVCVSRGSGDPACVPGCRDDGQCLPPYSSCDTRRGVCRCHDYTDADGGSWCRGVSARAWCDSAAGDCQCARSCAGRTCGDDGCGGSCGEEGAPLVACPDGYDCPAHSTCVANQACRCQEGFRAVSCDGIPCTGEEPCAGGTWSCRLD
jgi:hypothetical protein